MKLPKVGTRIGSLFFRFILALSVVSVMSYGTTLLVALVVMAVFGKPLSFTILTHVTGWLLSFYFVAAVFSQRNPSGVYLEIMNHGFVFSPFNVVFIILVWGLGAVLIDSIVFVVCIAGGAFFFGRSFVNHMEVYGYHYAGKTNFAFWIDGQDKDSLSTDAVDPNLTD